MTQKAITDNLRARFTADLAEFLAAKYDCDVCQVAAGTLMIPAVDEAGDDRWIKFGVIIPKASEEEGTDGYALAQDYQSKLDAAAERQARAEERKQKALAKKAKKEQE